VSRVVFKLVWTLYLNAVRIWGCWTLLLWRKVELAENWHYSGRFACILFQNKTNYSTVTLEETVKRTCLPLCDYRFFGIEAEKSILGKRENINMEFLILSEH
jgi:hypothetical protein